MLRKILRFFANGPEPWGEPLFLREACLDYGRSIANTEAACDRYAKFVLEIEELREQLRRERYQEEAQINAGLSID